MKIEVLEKTGITDARHGFMAHGEIRVVDDKYGAFCCANGWAKDVSGKVPTGERGSLDYNDPSKGVPTAKARTVLKANDVAAPQA